jgi:hypothetical protein
MGHKAGEEAENAGFGDIRQWSLFGPVHEGGSGTGRELRANGRRPSQEPYISSGSAAKAEAMAVARRFQPSVSSRKRLRPAAVSS